MMTGGPASGALMALASLLVVAGSLPPWWISRRFAPRLSAHERVAISWGLDLRPNRYESPRLVLALTPVLCTGTLIALAALALFAPPATDRSGALLGLLFLASFAFSGVHYGHLHCAAREAEQRAG